MCESQSLFPQSKYKHVDTWTLYKLYLASEDLFEWQFKTWYSWIRASQYNSYSERPNKVQQCIKMFIIPYFKWSSTCFGLHTAHHQEPKIAHAASGFAYVEGCRTCSCWTLSGSVRYLTTSDSCTSDNLPQYYTKPEAACAGLGFWWWAVCRPKHVDLHLK